MFNISDGEVAIAAAAGNHIRQNARHAQAIVDRKNNELTAAYARIARLERENAALKAERGRSNNAAFAAHLARH